MANSSWTSTLRRKTLRHGTNRTMRDVVPRVKRETLSDWRQCVYQPFIFHVAEIYCAWRKKKKRRKKGRKIPHGLCNWMNLRVIDSRLYLKKYRTSSRIIYIYAKLHKRCITRIRASCMTKMLNINSKIVCLRDENSTDEKF